MSDRVLDEDRLGCSKQAAAFGMDSNLPVQVWGHISAEPRFVVYMPRKETCFDMEGEEVEDKVAFAKDAAIILRALADKWDAWADGKIGNIYYPCKPMDQAIAELEKEKAGAS